MEEIITTETTDVVFKRYKEIKYVINKEYLNGLITADEAIDKIAIIMNDE